MILDADLLLADARGTVHAPGSLRFTPPQEGASARIVEVGPPEQIVGDPDEPRLRLEGLWLLPGLVQAHVHLNQTLLRGLAERRELLPWLRERIWPLEAAHDARSVLASARYASAEMLLSGATTALTMETTRHTAAAFAGAAEIGLRASIGSALMDGEDPAMPPGMARPADEALAECSELDEEWGQRTAGRLRSCVAPRFVLSCSEQLLQQADQLARERGLIWHSHVSENQGEVEEVRERTGMDNGLYFDEIGVLGPHVSLAHGVWLTGQERELFAERGVNLMHCPSANLKLGSGLADTVAMEAVGMNIALGSDGAPCNNRLDIFADMRLAALLASCKAGPSALDPARVFGWATAGGAAAAGRHGQVGELAAGLAPDLIALRPGSYAGELEDTAALYAHLVFAASGADVEQVWVDGVQKVRAGELIDQELTELKRDFDEQRRALLARSGL